MNQKAMLQVLAPAAGLGVVVLLLGVLVASCDSPPPPKKSTGVALATQAGSGNPVINDPEEQLAGLTLVRPPLDAPEWKPGPEPGMKVWDVKEGTGPGVPGFATVMVHYTGWLTSGMEFDSSVRRKEPIDFALDRVIKGWTVGIPGMKVGGIRRLYIPSELAYGKRGTGKDIPPDADLIFEVKLLGFSRR